MKQSHLMSLAESTANVAAGYGIAVLTQVLVFPLFGLNVSLSKNLGIGAVFTVLCGAPHNKVYVELMIMRSCSGRATLSA